MVDFSDQEMATRTRDALDKLIRKTLNFERPPYVYGTVTDIDRSARTADVLLAGQTTSVTVAMGSIQPSANGQVVRVDGRPGDRFIVDVIGTTTTTGATPLELGKPVVTLLGGAGTLFVSWVEISGAEFYDVNVADDAAFTTNNRQYVVVGDSKTVPNLDAGTYYVRVRAATTAGAGPWSDTGSDTTTSATSPSDGLVPTTSPNATVTEGIKHLLVEWTPISNADIVTYEVYIDTTSGFTPSPSELIGEVSGSFFFADKDGAGTPLSTSTLYYVRIIAKDNDGPSTVVGAQDSGTPQLVETGDVGTIGVNNITDGVIPPDVSGTPTIKAGVGFLFVQWTHVTNVDPVLYELHIDTTSGAFTPTASTLVGTTPSNWAFIRTLGSGAAYAELSQATTYYVKIVATDNDGTASNPSTAASGQTAQAGTADIENLSIETALIADLAVDTAKIGLLQVTEATIAALAVSTAKIQLLAVDTAQINALAVTEAKIGALAVTNAKIGLLAVDTAQIEDLAVETAKIQDLHVTTAKIALLAVDTAQIALLAVDTAQIQDLAVENAKIGLLAVDTAQIALLAVDTAQIADLAVENAKIGLLAVDTAQIALLAVDTAQINALAVTDAKIDTLTADKLTAGTINASVITVTNLDASNISTGTLSASYVNGGALTGVSIDIGGADATSWHVDSSGNQWNGHASFASAPFKVSSGGALTATSATITGAITATSGTFTGTLRTGTSSNYWTSSSSSNQVDFYNSSSLVGSLRYGSSFYGLTDGGGMGSANVAYMGVNGGSNIAFISGGSNGSTYVGHIDHLSTGAGNVYIGIATESNHMDWLNGTASTIGTGTGRIRIVSANYAAIQGETYVRLYGTNASPALAARSSGVYSEITFPDALPAIALGNYAVYSGGSTQLGYLTSRESNKLEVIDRDLMSIGDIMDLEDSIIEFEYDPDRVQRTIPGRKYLGFSADRLGTANAELAIWDVNRDAENRVAVMEPTELQQAFLDGGPPVPDREPTEEWVRWDWVDEAEIPMTPNTDAMLAMLTRYVQALTLEVEELKRQANDAGWAIERPLRDLTP